MQWLRGSGGEARGSAATGVGPTGGFGRVGSVGSASHPALKYKGAWQCLVGRAGFGQARASAPPPAFPHLRAKGRLSLLPSATSKAGEGGLRSSSGGPGELNFPPKIFIGLIYCKYGAHEHLGGAFATFGSQDVVLC